MLLVLVGVIGWSAHDVNRETAAAVADLARQQEALARALALNLSREVQQLDGKGPRGALRDLAVIEEPGRLRILLWWRGGSVHTTDGGSIVPSSRVAQALRSGAGSLRLTREEALHFGLPRRRAVLGLAPAPQSDVVLAVAANAGNEFDRERHAVRRSLLMVLIVALLVGCLGGVALWLERRDLELERALKLMALQREADGRLQRSARAATLGTLAMGIAHELSTPLAVVVARAERLQARLGADERASNAARVIAEQAGRMAQTLRGFLGLVRGQAETAEVEPAVLVTNAVALVEHRFSQARVTLRPSDAPPGARLRADARLMEHALCNLLLNACDASAPGQEVQLVLDVRADEVCFQVLDRGAGIPKEVAEQALELFYTTKGPGRGSGLGLAITHEIVKSHRGRLLLTARPDGGTCAELTLPRAKVEEGPDGREGC